MYSFLLALGMKVTILAQPWGKDLCLFGSLNQSLVRCWFPVYPSSFQTSWECNLIPPPPNAYLWKGPHSYMHIDTDWRNHACQQHWTMDMPFPKCLFGVAQRRAFCICCALTNILVSLVFCSPGGNDKNVSKTERLRLVVIGGFCLLLIWHHNIAFLKMPFSICVAMAALRKLFWLRIVSVRYTANVTSCERLISPPYKKKLAS